MVFLLTPLLVVCRSCLPMPVRLSCSSVVHHLLSLTTTELLADVGTGNANGGGASAGNSGSAGNAGSTGNSGSTGGNGNSPISVI